MTLIPSEVVTVANSDANNDEQSEDGDTDIGVTEGSSHIHLFLKNNESAEGGRDLKG